jgi:PHD/YefM family antitoxin component YafN of YafNO toxin-antitoxin module
MKTIGLFEAKTKLSQMCEEAARTHVPVTIMRRGKTLVCIEPVTEYRLSIKERRAIYESVHGSLESDDPYDFEPAARSRDQSKFDIEE